MVDPEPLQSAVDAANWAFRSGDAYKLMGE